MSQSRQLAAIMFTDIVGYTALMQQDARKINILKKKHHQIFYSITKQYKGKVLQYFGGATLSIFQSSKDAVTCGIELQSGFKEKTQIPVKIGVHIGDLIFDEEGVIGDGVNVASRVESLAVEGSLFISDKVYDEIRNQKSIQTQYLGTFNLKNVDRPVDLYAVSNDPLTVPTSDELVQFPVQKVGSKTQLALAWFYDHWSKLAIACIILLMMILGLIFFVKSDETKKGEIKEKSIAVLPFVNISKDLEQEYFSDGITEDIINQLSKVGDLKVISRTSVMAFKNTTHNTQEIAKQLNVAHILEGSVRKNIDQVRISTQLIDTKTDRNIWANTYDRKLGDILAVQREVSMEVVKSLQAELTPQEEEDINKNLTQNAEAYEFYLQGKYHLRSGSMEGLKKSYPLLRQAINLDPGFAEAYAEIANYNINQGAWKGDLTPELARKEAMPYIMKALELDPNLISARNQLGTIKFWFEWDFVGAEEEYIKGKDPGNYGFYYGFFLMLMGRFQAAEDHYAESHRLNPMDAYDRTHRGVIQYFLNNRERSIEILKEGIDLFPNNLTGYHKLGKIFLNVGNYYPAIKTLEQGMMVGNERIPTFLGDLGVAYFKSGQPEKAEQIIEELKSLESKGSKGSPSFFLAQIYAGIGETELAFEWLEKSYQAHEVEMIWLKIEPQFNSIRKDPRFSDLLKRVGF